MKRAYLANGEITAPVLPKDTIFHVDENTFNYLNNLLGADYCYLVINNEVVKILGCEAPDVLKVQRGIDNTERTIALVGDRIHYSTTSAEVKDAVTYIGYNLQVSGYINLDDGIITYQTYTILALGGITIQGVYPNLVIQDIPDNAGCGLNTPPEIPINLQSYRILDTGEARVLDDGTYREYA